MQVDSLPAEPQGKPKNTGVGSLSLFQGIFLTQESNWGLLHCRRILYQLRSQGNPYIQYIIVNGPNVLCAVYIQYVLYTDSELLQTPRVMGEMSRPVVSLKVPIFKAGLSCPPPQSPPLVWRLPIGDVQRPRNTAQMSAGMQGWLPSISPSCSLSKLPTSRSTGASSSPGTWASSPASLPTKTRHSCAWQPRPLTESAPLDLVVRTQPLPQGGRAHVSTT